MAQPRKIKEWYPDKTIRQNAELNGVCYGTAFSFHSRQGLICKPKKRFDNLKPITCVGIDCNWNKKARIFESAREAERELHISHIAINNCLKGRAKSAGGLKWKYLTVNEFSTGHL